MEGPQDPISRIWIDWPVRSKGVAVVVLPIVMLVAGFILLETMVQRENTAEQWVTYTIEVRRRLGSILNDLLEAETAARGYIISHKARLLPGLTRAKEHLCGIWRTWTISSATIQIS
ncbi:MAG TPA: CHASE3 domain-containing protein [Chthoniobacterales bacterium]